MKTVTIIGAGLAGTLLSIYLARRGYEVNVFESRPDMRKDVADFGRSINLALSCRGITSLRVVGLMDSVEKIMTPMRARAIHQQNGTISYQAFGRHEEEYINSILRNELNCLLLDSTDTYPNIHIHFAMKLHSLDLYKKSLIFEDETGNFVIKQYQHLIGADGAASKVREALEQEKIVSASREFLPHGYKELSINKAYQDDMRHDHLHIWPRESFLLLGNPNRDRSITGTLFLASQGKYSFESLDDESKLKHFFKSEFSDAYETMPNLTSEFFENPTGNLSTVQCAPWYFRDQCLLIGDAAHGVVPFFGQGMNSAFEDCRILNELLDNYQDDWAKVMPAFFEKRKINTDAVASMSMDNYREIQSKIRDKQFNLKKQVEKAVMHRYPKHYISKHVLVMFTNMPYAQAKAFGQLQSAFLNEICTNVNSIGEMDWLKVDKAINKYDKRVEDLTQNFI